MAVQGQTRQKAWNPPEKITKRAGYQWLRPIILATQETEIKRIVVQSQPRQKCVRPYLGNTQHEKGLVKWLKVKALSLSPSTTKKKKKVEGDGLEVWLMLHGLTSPVSSSPCTPVPNPHYHHHTHYARLYHFS
jgi:hypothetical protein